jgi:hypothetical protein
VRVTIDAVWDLDEVPAKGETLEVEGKDLTVEEERSAKSRERRFYRHAVRLRDPGPPLPGEPRRPRPRKFRRPRPTQVGATRFVFEATWEEDLEAEIREGDKFQVEGHELTAVEVREEVSFTPGGRSKRVSLRQRDD